MTIIYIYLKKKKTTMENPMRQSMRTPVMSMGVIPAKLHLDWTHVEQAMQNGDDPQVSQFCYPGGSKDVNHDVMPGDFSIGFKNCRNNSGGGASEMGFVSLAGFDTQGYHDQREMEDDVYPQGVVVTECRVSNPMGDSRAQDPDHGYSIVKAGTVPTLNNGPFPLYPNTFVMLRFPPSKYNTLTQVSNDIPFGGVNHRARQGTFASQIRPELVPFDYSDFLIHYNSAHVLMKQSKNKRGIKDISFDETLRLRKAYAEDNRKMSSAQEEASGHYWGTVNMVLAVLEVMKNGDRDGNKYDVNGLLAAMGNANTGVFSPTVGVYPVMEDIFKAAYYSAIMGVTEPTVPAQFSSDNGLKNKYLKLRSLGHVFHSGHVMGNFYSKASKIVGKPMNYAAPSETLDLMLGHFCM
jgi:hypothetical protein